MSIYRATHEAGFTLVETLVAITILLIFIVGPMTITTTTAKSSDYSSEQVIAFLLAQEGAELAQKARDDLVLKSFLTDTTHADYLASAWTDFTNTTGTYANCFNAAGCRLELMNEDLEGSLEPAQSCATISNCKLYFDPNGDRNRYTHTATGNESTLFTRTIFFTAAASPDEVRVVSRVTWRTGSLRDQQQVEVVTSLFNVYGN